MFFGCCGVVSPRVKAIAAPCAGNNSLGVGGGGWGGEVSNCIVHHLLCVCTDYNFPFLFCLLNYFYPNPPIFTFFFFFCLFFWYSPQPTGGREEGLYGVQLPANNWSITSSHAPVRSFSIFAISSSSDNRRVLKNIHSGTGMLLPTHTSTTALFWRKRTCMWQALMLEN